MTLFGELTWICWRQCCHHSFSFRLHTFEVSQIPSSLSEKVRNNLGNTTFSTTITRRYPGDRDHDLEVECILCSFCLPFLAGHLRVNHWFSVHSSIVGWFKLNIFFCSMNHHVPQGFPVATWSRQGCAQFLAKHWLFLGSRLGDVHGWLTGWLTYGCQI